MKKYQLSICIPTYNRGEYIGQTIQSIINACGDKYKNMVEITVSDNASKDNTQEIVNHYKKIFTNIVYFRHDENIGADRNYINAVKIASGEYCWLMGSDDIIAKDAISDILNIIKEKQYTGITVNNFTYNITLDEEIIRISNLDETKNTIYNDAGNCFVNLGLSFGYISALIVRKKLWDKIVSNNISNFFNAYVHTYIIAKMLTIESNWLFLSKKYVITRGGNDSFAQSLGVLKRLFIDIHGYHDIAKEVFGEKSKTYKNFTKNLLTYNIRFHITAAKKNKYGFDFFIPALKECLKYYWYYPTFWFKVFPIFLMPSFLHSLMKKLYIFLFVTNHKNDI